jgi:hypothetical protein
VHRRGKLFDLVIIPKRCFLRVEGGISKGIERAGQALLLDGAKKKKVALPMMTTAYSR